MYTYPGSRRKVMAIDILACVGVGEEGLREVLAVEVAATEKGVAYTSLKAYDPEVVSYLNLGTSLLPVSEAMHQHQQELLGWANNHLLCTEDRSLVDSRGRFSQ